MSDNLIDTKKEIAKAAGVSHDTVHKAKVIIEKGSEELKQELREGKKTINAGYREVTNRKPAPPPADFLPDEDEVVEDRQALREFGIDRKVAHRQGAITHTR